MTEKTWAGPSVGIWEKAGNWSPRGVPGASDGVEIDFGNDVTLDHAAGPVTIASLSEDGDLTVDTNASLTVTGELSVQGMFQFVEIGNGATANIGTLNFDTGNFDIGQPTSAFASKPVVTVGSITTSGTSDPGNLSLEGGTAAGDVTKLVVHSAAGVGSDGVVNCGVSLDGYSLIAFDSGTINTISRFGSLTLQGTHAFVADTGQTGSNSALVDLSEVDGRLSLYEGATLALAGDLHSDAGGILLSEAPSGGETGGNLTVAGLLTNGDEGFVFVEDGSVCAVGSYTGGGFLKVTTGGALNIGSAAGLGAAGTVTGHVQVVHGLIDFASGEIDTIAKGGSLNLIGDDAFVTNGGQTTTNAALTGLKRIQGAFGIGQGVEVAVAGPLNVSGLVLVGVQSVLSVAKSLFSTGRIVVNGSAGSTLDVKGLTSDIGTIVVGGSATFEGGIKGDAKLDFDNGNGNATVGYGPKSQFSVLDFGTGSTLDLRNEAVQHLSYDGATLSLDLASGQTQQIEFSGTFSGLGFKRDGHGGTEIFATSSHSQ